MQHAASSQSSAVACMYVLYVGIWWTAGRCIYVLELCSSALINRYVARFNGRQQRSNRLIYHLLDYICHKSHSTLALYRMQLSIDHVLPHHLFISFKKLEEFCTHDPPRSTRVLGLLTLNSETRHDSSYVAPPIMKINNSVGRDEPPALTRG